MKSKLEYVNLLITAIIGYLYQCMSSNKIIFFDCILDDYVFFTVKKYSLIIFIVLAIIYLVIFFLIRIRSLKKQEKKQLNDLSKQIFNTITNTDNDIDHSTFRVTVFKGINGKKSNPILVPLGRYQKRMPITFPSVRFGPDEGCAGTCYTTQQIISKQIEPYDRNKPDIYYNDCQDKLALNKDIATKLNLKSCTFLCLPLITQDMNQTWGVVVIDSIIKTLDFEKQSRKLESIILNYSFLFSLEA